MSISAKTIVTTAEGKVVEFTGIVSKFVAAHPRVATAIAFVIGGVLGHVI